MNQASKFDELPNMLTADDVAALLCVCKATVWSMCKEGALPAVKLGKRWYVPKAQLLSKIESLVNA